MLTDKQKNRMAKMCGLSKERKTELIRREVQKRYHPADETAILRKAVALLFDVIAELHDGAINNEEFKKYHELIERIKADVDAELGA